jgi:hypothetical protein
MPVMYVRMCMYFCGFVSVLVHVCVCLCLYVCVPATGRFKLAISEHFRAQVCPECLFVLA